MPRSTRSALWACLFCAVPFFGAGCAAQKIILPEESLATTATLERLVPEGTPIDEAQARLECYGFECTRENAVGVPYLQCVQRRTRFLWPFMGYWRANVYELDGVVERVQATYDLGVIENGLHVRSCETPRRGAERRAARRSASNVKPCPPAVETP